MTDERIARVVDAAGLLRDAYYNDRAEDVQGHLQELRALLALAEVERLRARVNSDAEIMGEANLKMQALREALRAIRDTAHDDERVRIVDEALDA